MKLKNAFAFPLFALACLAAFSGALFAQDGDNWAERFSSKMTPRLEQALERLPEDGVLDVYAVMRDRPSTAELMDLVRGVQKKHRHEIVTNVLRSHANTSQKAVRTVLDQRKGRTAGTPVKVLWLANVIRFTGTAADIAAVRDLPDVGYVGINESFPAETYRDVGAGDAPGVPYYDGFETGAFGPEWTTATTGTGRIQITTAHGPIGTYHVTMDSSVDNSYGTCTMTLSVDLSTVTNCVLLFQFKEFSDEADPEDHVSISADGVNFYTVLSLEGSSTYEQKAIDLDEAATAHGISFNNDFKIRFSWRDNYSISTDGFAFDEIKVEEGDPPPIPPEPNIVNLQAPDCWDIGITGQGALILNIDSGVDYTHPDLVNQMWTNPGELPGNGIDDDGNGYVDDIHGYDFENNDGDPMPTSSGHGTNTGGIVCGDGTSGYKTGMAPDATMAAAKIGDMSTYWEAQQYAVLIGADAITSSYSYKWGIHDPDYHVFRTNCVNELIAGVIHANSLGNQGDQTSSFPIPFNISTPGNCPGPWIHPDQVVGGVSSMMGCAGVNLDESLYTPSGQGPSAWEDITIYDPAYAYSQNPAYWDYPYGGFGGGLPGLLKPDVCTYTGVRTTNWGGGYYSGFGGTSAATPHLGGAMCLLISANGEASPRKISQALQETAEDKGPVGKDSRYGAGKVQAYDAALRLIYNVEVDNREPSIGSSIELTGSGPAGNLNAVFWSLTLGSSTIPGIGDLEIGDPRKMFLKGNMPASGKFTTTINVPNNPVWIGRTVYFQGVMDDNSGATGQYLFSLVEDVTVQP